MAAAIKFLLKLGIKVQRCLGLYFLQQVNNVCYPKIILPVALIFNTCIPFL
jgi:hypothetical protein